MYFRSNQSLATDYNAAPLRQTRADELQAQITKIFRRLRIAVIFAGDKTSAGAVINPGGNQRSWKSYESVARDISRALMRLGVRETAVLSEDMQLGRRLKAARSHMAWINSGGVQGASSVAHAPAMMEMFGLPYVGHDPMTAAMLDNKFIFKRQALAAGLPTATFATWHPSYNAADPLEDEQFIAAFGARPQGALIVKPVSGRASLHVHHVADPGRLREVCASVFEATNNNVLIESYLPGREYCIAVAGPVLSRQRQLIRNGAPFAFSAIERVLEKDEYIFTSMDVRPITGARARALDPVEDATVIRRLKLIARQVYHTMGLETLVRLDLREDANGEIKILEANPKPDLTEPAPHVTSLVCMGLAEESMDYDDLILSLVADRIDTLFAQNRSVAHPLRALL